uniref:Uncharacterized protein n=1 Tax=Bursaphelenchus xylophilus TaxID=6326 RepID=A0A1I7SBM8_BURXY
MDGSMEAGPSRSDAKTDSPPIDVSIEKESKETRMKPLEKARAKLAQTKQMNINSCGGVFRKLTDGETRERAGEGASKTGSEEADDVQNISSRSILK